MQVDIGPVDGSSVLAWTGYADAVLAHFGTPGVASPLPAEDLDRLAALAGEWASTARAGEPFRWSARRDTEEVEFLLKALLELGNAVEAEHDAGRLSLRPEAADAFHLTLVRQMLAQLGAEGPSCAQFAEALREQWGQPAND